MLSPNQQGLISTVVFAICTIASLCDHGSRMQCGLFPTVAAFASGNGTRLRRTGRWFFDARSTPSSLLLSAEPASNLPPDSPPAVPTANVINGASSLQARFQTSSGGTNEKMTAGGMVTAGGTRRGLSLSDRIRQMSNVASFLCVLDCTVLPLVTVALPLLGVVNLGAARMQAIDKLGHSLALCFVLPVGSLTALINYLSHKKKTILALAIVGLTMVGLANSHIHVHHWPSVGSFSLNWIGTVLHKIQGCGASPWHRIINVSGCAFLLGSNYWSQRQDGCATHGIAGAGDCGHDHGGCNN